MKKFKLFTAISAVLLLSFFVTNGLHASEPGTAGNKWKIISVTGPKTCKLGAKEFTFKIKIKNMNDVKSTRENINFKIILKYQGNQLLENEEGFWTPQIASGKTAIVSVSVSHDNIKQFTNSIGNKTISGSFQVINESVGPDYIKDFAIKVWDGSTR
jgi:hypothetical protein